MPDFFEVIKARIKDDAPILIDRMMRSPHREIVFVLPKNSVLGLNLESLDLINQEAKSIGKNIFFVSTNPQIQEFAGKIGVTSYENLNDIEFSQNGQDEREEIAPENPMRNELKKKLEVYPPQHFQNTEYRPLDIMPPASHYQVAQHEEPTSEPEAPPEVVVPEGRGDAENPQKQYYDNFEKNLELFYRGDETNPEGNQNIQDQYRVEPRVEVASQRLSYLENRRNSRVPFSNFSKIIGTLIFLVIIAAAGALYLILPRANVDLVIARDSINTVIPITVSKNALAPQIIGSVIPGQYFIASKVGSKSFILNKSASGPVSANAQGTIRIYNAYSASPQRLVAQTRFETKDGKVYRTPSAVIIPGAKLKNGALTPSTVDIQVVSDLPGEAYNIGPSYFTIPGFKSSPKYAGFYARSFSNITGGKTGASLVLTQGDIDKAQEELKSELIDSLKSSTSAKLDQDFRLIDGATQVKIDSFKSSARAGSKVDSFILTMKVTWQALVFKESDLKTMVEKNLAVKFPSFDSSKFDLNIVYPKPEIDWRKGEMNLAIAINKTVTSSLDPNALKQELAGKDQSEIRSVISQKSFIESATINLWPFWVKRAPDNPDKIDIKINDSQP